MHCERILALMTILWSFLCIQHWLLRFCAPLSGIPTYIQGSEATSKQLSYCCQGVSLSGSWHCCDLRISRSRPAVWRFDQNQIGKLATAVKIEGKVSFELVCRQVSSDPQHPLFL